MLTPRRISYAVLVFMLVLAGGLHLGPPLLAILFSYFALSKLLALTKNKCIALILFLVVVAGIACGAGFFTRTAIRELPEVADSSLPSASAWAQARQIELPFTDFDSLKAFVIGAFKEETNYLKDVATFARNATTFIIFVAIGIVAAVSLFFNSQLDLSRNVPASRNNLYSVFCGELSDRFRDFSRSFATVMGAQITISLINTTLTAIFVLAVQLPYGLLVIPITFLCGLVPIVGNLVSNGVIVFLALTVSLKLAIGALVFLVALHKLEYFLNSKIIGERIRNPVWLTLIALIIGERLMGIPGLILAPVVLNYVRVDMLKVEVVTAPEPTRVAGSADRG